MIPKDLDGKPWPLDKANIKLQEFREKVLAELRQRDSDNGIPDGGKVYYVEEDSNGRQTMMIDPVLAAAKHTGSERQNLTLDLWEDFCDLPQDPGLVEVPLVRSSRKHAPEKRVVSGQPPAGAPRTLSDAPTKRRRGRPRKSMAIV